MKLSFHPHRLGLAVGAVVFAVVVCCEQPAKASESSLVHETRVVQQIQSYCATSWRNASIPRTEWPDCSQQVFAELLERMSRQQLGQAIAHAGSRERRELNRSIWRIVKRWLRSARHRPLNGFDVADPASPLAEADDQPTLDNVLRGAAEKISTRQSRILRLIGDGHSVCDVSQQLQLSAACVSDEKYRAIQKIRRSIHLS